MTEWTGPLEGAAWGSETARRTGPGGGVVPVLDAPPGGTGFSPPGFAPAQPRKPLIPEPDDASSRRGAYVVGGNVLGAGLGVLTVAALVVSLVVAIHHKDPEPILASNAASRSGQAAGNGGGALDYSTSSNTAGGAASASTAEAGTAATTDSALGGSAAETAAPDAVAGGGTPTSGAFEFAPPTGKFTATGTGYRVNSPPGGAGTKVSNPSFEIKNVGNGCYDFKITLEPDNSNTETLCRTADGGVVQTKNVQYLRTVIVGNLAEVSTSTLICNPPTIAVPANPTPGQAGEAGGNCLGTNTSSKLPGVNKQVGAYTVVGKETVAGVEAIHVQKHVKMSPNDTQNTQNGDVTENAWYAPNGLLVRWGQNVDATTCLVSCAALTIKFHQESDLTVTSTTPG